MNEARLQAFLARALADVAAAQSAALVAIGDRLGLYRALARGGALTPAELASRTGTHERYVAEWLANQACGGYVEYEPGNGRYRLAEECAAALSDEASRAFVAGAFQAAVGLVKVEGRVAAAFRDGGGVPAADYPAEVAEGSVRSSQVMLGEELLGRWLPSLEGTEARLRAGAFVADVGCGRGAALLSLAGAFPLSRVLGIDVDAGQIAAARDVAARAGLSGRVRFEALPAESLPGGDYDLVLCIESLHEFPDPVAAARRMREALRPDGVCVVVEPFASDRLEQDQGVWGRLVSSTSVLRCLPVSAAAGGFGLGARVGEGRLREVLAQASFARVERLVESPFRIVLEARP